MKEQIQIDTTMKGILQAISYIFICVWSWLNEQGIDAYAFSVLLGFMVADMLLGVWKSKRVPELENPTSREAKKGIAAKIVMFTIPVVSGLIWGLFDKTNALRVVNTLIIALALAEGYSVIGNAGAIYSRKNLTEYDAITYIFKTLSGIVKEVLERFLNKLKNESAGTK